MDSPCSGDDNYFYFLTGELADTTFLPLKGREANVSKEIDGEKEQKARKRTNTR